MLRGSACLAAVAEGGEEGVEVGPGEVAVHVDVGLAEEGDVDAVFEVVDLHVEVLAHLERVDVAASCEKAGVPESQVREAAEMIGRVAPLLGLRPQVEPGETAGITLTSN